jgi:predicted MPP superfamily phosphohydrolase
VGGLGSPEGNLFPYYDSGLFRIDDTSTAVVSRGIGNTVRIPRFYDPPELVVVTLRKN